MHFVDTQALRQRGLHHEADVLDQLPPPSPPAETPAALVIHGDARDAAHSSAGSDRAAGSGSRQPAAASGAGARSAGADRGDSESHAPAPAGSQGGHPGAAGAESETAPGHDEHGTPSHFSPLLPNIEVGRAPDFHSDPLAGIRSGHLRQRIEHQAFATASGTAQDSAIAQAADRLLPPELRGLLRHDVPPVDASPAARVARIAALSGEIPKWAKGDPENDPAILRAQSNVKHTVSASPEARPESLWASRRASSPTPSLSPERAVSRSHDQERER